MTENSQGYGSSLTANEITNFLTHIYGVNVNTANIIKPVCIWGKPGIGKTQLIKDFAKENGYDFAYCAPAQFEEMGDFHGIPYVLNGKTVYNTPNWVPTGSDKPGILLIDDFNRADDRILRGLMQLLQNNSLMSWTLPDNWNIICTANPEGSDYSISNLDDAMLTRMMHITMRFEPKEWARWALKNKVDERGIDFVLTYPEMADGKLTNPRTLTSFFAHTKQIVDLKKSINHVHIIASSLLDRETTGAFATFVQGELNKLVTPEEIINSKDFTIIEKKIRSLCLTSSNIRIDILSAMTTRMLIYLKDENYSNSDFSNLLNFLLMDFLPNDLRTAFHLDLIGLKDSKINKLLANKTLTKLLVGDYS
jgi:hypothetical protein